MKKVKCYLESSALWNLFYEEKGSETVEYCIRDENILCISSVWSNIEITRGIKKRENQNEITKEEAKQLQFFIEKDLMKLINTNMIELVKVTDDNISLSKKFIWKYNLYGSDALHLATATQKDCKVILVDDYHFKRLSTSIMKDQGVQIYPTPSSIDELKKTFETHFNQ